MSDGSRGIISLRKKKTSARPTISGPRPIPEQRPSTDDSRSINDGAPLIRTETSHSTLRGRQQPQGTGNTADLVKRRYSTRFAGFPIEDGAPPPMPTIPAIPPRFQPPQSRSPTRDDLNQPRGVKLDARALRDPNLVPEQYIATHLGDADEIDVQAHQNELRRLKTHTDADLQHNVYQNRTQFIKISKEAEKLKTEMQTLRGLMTDLTSALNQAALAAGAEVSTMSVAERKRANRSSVANLEALWSTHLQALWQRVEGSQKHLPAAPGRHILYESGRWVELNAATWKPRRRVHLILLNDHLLIATEKKRSETLPGMSPRLDGSRKTSGQQPVMQTTLVADRCFALQDAQIVDISRKHAPKSPEERSPVSNAISVRVGNESLTFATGSSSDSANEKNSLLVAYRKANEELRKQLATQHGDRERSLDENYLSSPSLQGNGKPNSPHLGFSSLRSASGSAQMIEVDGRQQPLRWLETQLDGLDIDVALQRFEDAVDKVEKLRRTAKGIRANPAAAELLNSKIDERANRLARLLARRLRLNAAGRESTRETALWLARLGQSPLAVNEFLAARTLALDQRTRQLPFAGSLPPHILALSYVTFASILHSLQVFGVAFPGPANASASVRWAKERVDDFNAALARRLSGLSADSELRAQCLADARAQCGMLKQLGVDFEGLVGHGLD